jgi:hypothetical protein
MQNHYSGNLMMANNYPNNAQTVPVYRQFPGGRYIDGIHDFLESLKFEKRTVMAVEQIVEQRIKALNSNDEEQISMWCDKCFVTLDAVASFKDQIKIIKNCQLLLDTGNYKLSKGMLVLAESVFKNLKGTLMSRSAPPFYGESNYVLERTDAKLDRIWNVETGANLAPYADLIFDIMKQKYCNNTAMDVRFAKSQDMPTVAPVYINRVNAGSALVNLPLDSDVGNDTVIVGMLESAA